MGKYGTPGTDQWYTPKHITDAVQKAFGIDRFELDPATYPGCTRSSRNITAEQDGLRTDWQSPSSVWVNPPSGKPDSRLGLEDLLTRFPHQRTPPYTMLFWTRLMLEAPSQAGFLCYNMNSIFQSQKLEFNMLHHPVLFLKDRVRYERPDGSVGMQGMFHSAIVLLGEFDPAPLAVLGDIVTLKK